VPGTSDRVLVYDGDCGFCTTAASWITGRWTPAGRAEALPWQHVGEAGLARLGLTTEDVTQAAWWVEDGHRFRGHLAVAHALMAAGGGWGRVGRALLVPPLRAVAGVGYRLVARYRYRLPGGTPACRL
jgi:predicted DCC family thiol-disulfide oxidoreductase YuxK